MNARQELYLRTIIGAVATTLSFYSLSANAESVQEAMLFLLYPELRGNTEVKPILSDYEATCAAIQKEETGKIEALPKVEWTGEDSEAFWSRIAVSATRLSTAPRLSEADMEKGEGILEAFGTRYMPNAYAVYQEARASAREREQLLAENFPNGRESDATGGGLYDKVSTALAKAVSEMFRRHDELAHFYLLHQVGVMSDAELARADGEKIQMMLPAEGAIPEPCTATCATPTPAERDFAVKYLPETWAAYQCLENEFSEGKKTMRNCAAPPFSSTRQDQEPFFNLF